MDTWPTLRPVAAAVFAVFLYLLASQSGKHLPYRRLLIGVISARNHFSHRQVIRETWGSVVQAMPDMELVFVLGEEDCSIHPDDRISPYSCEKLHIKKDIEEFEVLTFFKSHQVSYHSNLQNVEHLLCFIGLGFRVIRPVILKTLSVRADVMKHLTETRIMLWDPEEMIEAVLLTDKPHSVSNGYYNYKLSTPLLLPAGFEGELRIPKLTENTTLCLGDDFSPVPKMKWVCDWRNHSLLEYKFLRTNEEYTTRWRDTYCLLISAEFTIADKESLLIHEEGEDKRNQEWKLQLNNIDKKIDEEQEEFNDILKLPVVDVYAHLPYKVLGFLNWVSGTYDALYALKVDDDTFVNVELVKKLTADGVCEDVAWWSVFHHHRTVPVFGKWADAAYPAIAYPTFPAGAGYLMTGRLAQKVGRLHGQVAAYSGEDVSLGIWVTTVASSARQVNIPCWLPHPSCFQSVLVPQLSVGEIKGVWIKHIHINDDQF